MKSFPSQRLALVDIRFESRAPHTSSGVREGSKRALAELREAGRPTRRSRVTGHRGYESAEAAWGGMNPACLRLDNSTKPESLPVSSDDNAAYARSTECKVYGIGCMAPLTSRASG